MAREFPLATVLTARDNASPALRRLGDVGEAMGKRFERVGRKMSMAVTAPVLAVGYSIARTNIELDNTLSQVRVLATDTAAEFKKLDALAFQLGETTKFSAADAAGGMRFLAQSGYKTQQILDSMPAVLQLAAAGQLDVAEAGDLASNAVKGFGLQAADTSRVADILAHAAGSSNTSIRQMGDAFTYAAPAAASVGMSMEEAAAVIGSLSDAGIQGEMAGTALRGAIAGLIKPAGEAQRTLVRLGVAKSDLYNADGSINFTGFIEKLHEVGATGADVLSIFGQRPGTGVLAMLNQLDSDGADSLRKRKESMENESEGAAQKQAEAQSVGLSKALENLGSKWGTLQAKIGRAGFVQAASYAADRLADLFLWASKLPAPILGAASGIAALAASIGPLALGISTLIKVKSFSVDGFLVLRGAASKTKGALFSLGRTVIGGTLRGVTMLTSGVVRLAGALMAQVVPTILRVGAVMLLTPVGQLITGVAALTAAGVFLYKNWDRVAGFFVGVWDRIKTAFGDGLDWIKSKLDGTKLGKVLEFFGVDLGGDGEVEAGESSTLAPALHKNGREFAYAPPVDTRPVAPLVAPGPGQDGRARVEIDVRSGREDVRVRATAVEDVELDLSQGLALGVVG